MVSFEPLLHPVVPYEERAVIKAKRASSSTITSSIYTFCCNASISSPHFVLTNFSKTVQQLSHDLVYDAHAQPLIGSLLYPQQLFSSLAISRARPFSFKNCSLSCLISRACCSLSQRRWLFKRQTRFSASMLSKFGQFLSSWKFILAREAKHFSSSRFSENSCARITSSTELCFCKRRSSQREVSLLIWYSRDNSKRLLTSCWSEIMYLIYKVDFTKKLHRLQPVSFLDTLHGGQFTLSTQLIQLNYLVIPSHRRSTIVSLVTYSFTQL